MRLYQITPYIKEIEAGAQLRTRDGDSLTFTGLETDQRSGNWVQVVFDKTGKTMRYRPTGLMNCMLRDN